jgi:hypothetical protein
MRPKHSSKRGELTERVRELPTLLWITIFECTYTRLQIATQARAATIPIMGTNVKPLSWVTWEEVKPKRNDL